MGEIIEASVRNPICAIIVDIVPDNVVPMCTCIILCCFFRKKRSKQQPRRLQQKRTSS